MFRNETQKMIYKNPVTLLTGYRMRNEYFMWCEFLVTCYWHHSASVKYWFSVRIATYKMKCINDDDDRTFYQRFSVLRCLLIVMYKMMVNFIIITNCDSPINIPLITTNFYNVIWITNGNGFSNRIVRCVYATREKRKCLWCFVCFFFRFFFECPNGPTKLKM